MGNWIALLLAIAGNVGANIAFKHFLQSTDLQRSWASVGTAVSRPSLWAGTLLGVSLLVCYLYAIRSIPLSTAYTVATGLSIVGVTCAGVMVFGETVGIRTVTGIVVVIFGVALITSG